MKNWKTTLFGVLGGLPTLLALLGIHLPAGFVQGAAGIGAVLVGWHAQDAAPAAAPPAPVFPAQSAPVK